MVIFGPNMACNMDFGLALPVKKFMVVSGLPFVIAGLLELPKSLMAYSYKRVTSVPVAGLLVAGAPVGHGN